MAAGIVVDQAALDRLLKSPNGPAARRMLQLGRKVEGLAKREVNVDTGQLRSSISTQLMFFGNRITVRVGSNVFYAWYIHDGTGIYGPRHQPIKPVRAKLLVFRPRGGGKVVFARQVRGVKSNPFLLKALRAVR